jgi:TRAP-type C4-dicarboxylate transport system permease small subunit
MAACYTVRGSVHAATDLQKGAIQSMKNFHQFRLRIESAFSMALLALLIVLVFVAAVLRWFGISIVWSVDMAQLLFTWLCFIGADLAYYHNKHMGVDLIKKRFHTKSALVLDILLNVLVMIFVASIFYYGTKLSISNYVRKFNSLPVSYSFATIAAPIGACLMFLTGLQKLGDSIRALRTPTVEKKI